MRRDDGKNKGEIAADAVAEQAEVNQKDKLAKEISEWVISIIIAVALALVVHNYVGQLIKVDGPSMEPNLYTGQRMLVTKFTYRFKEPQRGEVVVTHFPNDRFNYVKRVIALEGETVAIENGRVLIDGVPIEEPYIKEMMLTDMASFEVPEGHVYVMGDNRNVSRDSRSHTVGSIPEELLVGKVQAVVWPLDAIHSMEHHEHKQ